MSRFKKVYVEITNVCNMDCVFCHKTQREKNFMTPDFFSIVLSEIKPFTDYIFMHILGEPLLHPQLSELLAISYNMGIHVNITTNGTLIPKRSQALLNSPAVGRINISLHSMNDEKDDFDAYMNGVFKFIRDARKQREDIIICLRLWNLGSGADNNEFLKKIANEFELPENLEEKITDRNGLTLAKNVYLQFDRRFVWPDINGEQRRDSGYCFGLKTHCGILVDGTVVPCCLDCEGNIPLGNIKTQRFDEIINGSRGLKMQNGFKERRLVEHLCRTCGFN